MRRRAQRLAVAGSDLWVLDPHTRQLVRTGVPERWLAETAAEVLV